nr:MAG TPA: hypothetical protein [Caudoviricetes sp.]
MNWRERNLELCHISKCQICTRLLYKEYKPFQSGRYRRSL